MIRRTITAHISPYFGGLAPETHDYVRYLNDEARRRKSGVIWIALRNRILVHGDLNRALKSTASLGTLMLRDALSAGYLAHKPQPFWETAAIEGEEPVLRRGNSSYKKELRRLDKNRGRAKFKYERPGKIHGLERPSDSLRIDDRAPGLGELYTFAVGDLYRLVAAIPRPERDRNRIYPADFIAPYVAGYEPPRDRHRWGPGFEFGIRDYAEHRPELRGYRQKAASIVRQVETALAAPYLERVAFMAAYESSLRRSERLYRSEPGRMGHWPSKPEKTVFDKIRKGRKRRPEPRTVMRQRRNYQQLMADEKAHNAQYDSYWNRAGISAGIGKLPPQLRSLNMLPGAAEVQRTMIANLERDFTLAMAEVA